MSDFINWNIEIENLYLEYVCGLNITGKAGNIRSPGYPLAEFTNNVFQCTWTIFGTEGSLISLNFTYFELGFDPTCHYDYVKVSCGFNANFEYILHGLKVFYYNSYQMRKNLLVSRYSCQLLKGDVDIVIANSIIFTAMIHLVTHYVIYYYKLWCA